MRFEWDKRKAQANLAKHGVSFESGRHLLLSEDDYVEIYDGLHSDDEDRFIAIGAVRRDVILVVHTERVEDLIRIISVRKATKRESQLYRDHMQGRR